MLNIGLQFFAHKKVWVPLRTAVIPNPSVWALNAPTGSTFCRQHPGPPARHQDPSGYQRGHRQDDTLFATATGVVRFERLGRTEKRFLSILRKPLNNSLDSKSPGPLWFGAFSEEAEYTRQRMAHGFAAEDTRILYGVYAQNKKKEKRKTIQEVPDWRQQRL